MNATTTDPKAIFFAALDCGSETALSAYLDDACHGDSELRARVEQLLKAHRQAGNFLGGDRSPEATADSGADILPAINTLDQITACLGTSIGPYKLLELIGEGGMGLVYMAEQQRPVRRLVALKLIKPGMDTKQVIARFEAERQALAMMDHPNIAKILDAGTTGEGTRGAGLGTRENNAEPNSRAPNPEPPAPTAGRPYFVMELVRGLPITDFCDQKRLSVRQRLELFIQVCQAVQHAHQKGIIHRDLKPTNVLVTLADTIPVPKIIDFGIAKALGQSLTDHTLHTGFSQLIGTPLYMSPEQAEFNQFGVDTRSDVYSLGVLLYELLTGTTPFDKATLQKAGLDELRRLIREEEPETVSARLARTRKTGSRDSGLGAEGRRSESLPRIPNPEPRAPRMSELDWIVAKTLEKDRSRRYESPSALAADIQRYLSDEPVQACPPSTLYRIRKFASKRRAAFTTAILLAASLLLGIALSTWQAIRATTAEAQAVANEAKAKREEQMALTAAASEREARQAEAAQRKEAEKNFNATLQAVDRLLAQVGGAELRDIPRVQLVRRKMMEDALELYTQLIGDSRSALNVRARAAETWKNLAKLCAEDLGDYEAARKAYVTAISITRLLVTEAPASLEHRESLATILSDAGYIYSWGLKEHAESEKLFRESRDLFKTLSIQISKRSFDIELAATEMGLAMALTGQHRPDEALACLRRASESYDQSQSATPHNRGAVWVQIAETLQGADAAQADTAYRRAIAEFREHLPTPRDRIYCSTFARTLIVASRHLRFRHPDEIEPLLREARELLAPLCTDYPFNPHYQGCLEDCVQLLATVLDASNRAGEADSLLNEQVHRFPENQAFHAAHAKRIAAKQDKQEAIALLSERIKSYPSASGYYVERGLIHGSLDHTEEARSDLTRAIERNTKDYRVWRYLGDLHAQLKQYDAAVADYSTLIERYPKDMGLFRRRGELYTSLKQYQLAIADFDRFLTHPGLETQGWVIKRRGKAYFHAGKYDKALADLKTALESKPTDLSTLTWVSPQLVASCPDESFWRGMLELADRAVELTGGSASSYAVRADLRRAMQQFDQAAADLELALATAPENATLANNIAWRFVTWPDARAQDAQRAVELARKAVVIDPENGHFANTLGVALYRTNDWQAAIAALQKSLELNQDGDSYNGFFLAMAHWRLGDQEEARKWYDQAVEWMDKNKPNNEILLRFRAEAADLLKPQAQHFGQTPDASEKPEQMK